MQQMTLFDGIHVQQAPIVNIASVPQLSPFRYPGGKTWLVPRLRRWLSPHIRRRVGLNPVRPAQLIEPFAGGGIIGLTTAAERLADHVTMVEIDEEWLLSGKPSSTMRTGLGWRMKSPPSTLHMNTLRHCWPEQTSHSENEPSEPFSGIVSITGVFWRKEQVSSKKVKPERA